MKQEIEETKVSLLSVTQEKDRINRESEETVQKLNRSKTEIRQKNREIKELQEKLASFKQSQLEQEHDLALK